MKNIPITVIVAMLVLSAAFMCTTVMIANERDEWRIRHNTLQYQAINMGYAQYNPTNAVWQWIPRVAQ